MEKEHLEIILEDMNSKFDLILEGHVGLRQAIDDLDKRTTERFDLVDLKFEALNKKIDRVDQRLSDRIDNVEKSLGEKIDAVAADLAAHRADTEAHSIYRVRES